MHNKCQASSTAPGKISDAMELDCKQKPRPGEVAVSDGCVVIHLSDLTSADKVKERKTSMTGKLPRKDKRVVQHLPKTAARALRSVTCDWQDCDKTFTTFYAMSAHYRTHTGQRPYACTAPGCKKSFRSSSDLQRHNRTHTGEKPYECMFHGCFKSFSTLAIRKVHMRTHTGERPYSCEYPACSMTFSSLTNYKNHARTHTGEKPYVCQHPGCGKRFAEHSTMHKHKLVHVESLMVCGACGRRFRHTVTYQAHRKREHAWMFAEGEEDVAIKTEAGAAGGSESPRIQLLLTELDVRTVEIDGAATSVLVLPAEGDGAEVAGEGSDLQLLGCAEALVVSDDASSEQLVLQGEVTSGVLRGEGATGEVLVEGQVPLVLRGEGAAGEVLVEGQVPLVLRGEGAAGEVLVEGQVPLVLREEVLHGVDDAPVHPDEAEPSDAGLSVVEEQL